MNELVNIIRDLNTIGYFFNSLGFVVFIIIYFKIDYKIKMILMKIEQIEEMLEVRISDVKKEQEIMERKFSLQIQKILTDLSNLKTK